jgi:hypothetical protein
VSVSVCTQHIYMVFQEDLLNSVYSLFVWRKYLKNVVHSRCDLFDSIGRELEKKWCYESAIYFLCDNSIFLQWHLKAALRQLSVQKMTTRKLNSLSKVKRDISPLTIIINITNRTLGLKIQWPALGNSEMADINWASVYILHG